MPLKNVTDKCDTAIEDAHGSTRDSPHHGNFTNCPLLCTASTAVTEWLLGHLRFYGIKRKCQPVCCKVKMRNMRYTPAAAIPLWRCHRISRAQPSYCFIHFQTCGPRVCTSQLPGDCSKPWHSPCLCPPAAIPEAPCLLCRKALVLRKHLFESHPLQISLPSPSSYMESAGKQQLCLQLVHWLPDQENLTAHPKGRGISASPKGQLLPPRSALLSFSALPPWTASLGTRRHRDGTSLHPWRLQQEHPAHSRQSLCMAGWITDCVWPHSPELSPGHQHLTAAAGHSPGHSPGTGQGSHSSVSREVPTPAVPGSPGCSPPLTGCSWQTLSLHSAQCCLLGGDGRHLRHHHIPPRVTNLPWRAAWAKLHRVAHTHPSALPAPWVWEQPHSAPCPLPSYSLPTAGIPDQQNLLGHQLGSKAADRWFVTMLQSTHHLSPHTNIRQQIHTDTC